LTRKFFGEYNELIDLGDRLLATKHYMSPPNMYGGDTVDQEPATQWATSSQNLLVRVFGEESARDNNFTKETSRYISYTPAYCTGGNSKQSGSRSLEGIFRG
jgi:hypothetical protein